MNRIQAEHWFITIARKYCVLARYIAINYINDFPADTFFYDANQTILEKMVPITGRASSFLVILEFSKTKQNREEGVKLKNNRPINLPKVITFSTDKYTTYP